MQIKDHATNHAINHSIVVVINNIKIMKNILLLTFLLYPALCLAQNVKVSSSTDDFTGTRAITTSGFEFITEGPPDICKLERVSDMLVMLTLSSFVYIQNPQ